VWRKLARRRPAGNGTFRVTEVLPCGDLGPAHSQIGRADLAGLMHHDDVRLMSVLQVPYPRHDRGIAMTERYVLGLH
jgi:hypothetical protein